MTKRAVIITGPGFQDEEVVYPYYRLLEAGFHTEQVLRQKMERWCMANIRARA